MTQFLKPLRSKQRLALELLLQGKDRPTVCHELDVKPWTLAKWMALPAWKVLWDEERAAFGLTDGQLIQRARREMLLKATDAVKTIDDLRSGSENEKIKLQAAKFQFEAAVGKAGGQAAASPTIPVEVAVRILTGLLEDRRGARLVTGSRAADLELEHAQSAG